MDQEVARARRHEAIEVSQYRRNNQLAQMRREYDLNDPLALKKDKPVRTGDDDPRLGPSSMQKFDGEDLHASQRLQQQKQQMRVWTQLHLFENQQARQREDAETKYLFNLGDTMSCKAPSFQIWMRWKLLSSRPSVMKHG
jgi:hypothetical protein